MRDGVGLDEIASQDAERLLLCAQEAGGEADGDVLAATFLANTGGDLEIFGTDDRLASVAGLAPAPRDSGRSAEITIDLAATTADCCAPATSPRSQA